MKSRPHGVCQKPNIQNHTHTNTNQIQCQEKKATGLKNFWSLVLGSYRVEWNQGPDGSTTAARNLIFEMITQNEFFVKSFLKTSHEKDGQCTKQVPKILQ